MDTIELIRHNQLVEYQRYMDYEKQRLLTDELTEASEKLAAPISNPFEYEIGPDGELWFQGQAIGPILDRSIEEASLVAERYPQFTVELARRYIERQEYDEQCRLALSSDDDPDTLVVLSPIPDAVLGGVNLGAYDLERKKAMVRIYERSNKGVKATSLSLDLSDRDGLKAIARQFNQDIADDESSEQILRRRFYGYSKEFGDKSAIQIVRQTYDNVLSRRYGGNWYAGRQESPVHDAMQFIQSQPDLIKEHIDIMMAIATESDPIIKSRLQKEARYNFIAALDRRLKGKADVHSDGDGGVLSGAGADAKLAGIEYKSSCPTGQDLTAEEAIVELGLGNQLLTETFVSKQCPICGAKNVLTKRTGETIRGLDCGCLREICSGRIVKGNKLDTSNLITAQKRNIATFKESKEDKLLRLYGPYASVESQLAIGGVDRLVVDRRTGEVIKKI